MIGGADHHLLTCYKDTAHQIALRYGHSACADYLECVGEWNYYHTPEIIILYPGKVFPLT